MALKRLNILKISCHVSWHLDVNTLECIYNALTGSIFAIARMTNTNMGRLQTDQNRSLIGLVQHCRLYSLKSDKLTILGKDRSQLFNQQSKNTTGLALYVFSYRKVRVPII